MDFPCIQAFLLRLHQAVHPQSNWLSTPTKRLHARKCATHNKYTCAYSISLYALNTIIYTLQYTYVRMPYIDEGEARSNERTQTNIFELLSGQMVGHQLASSLQRLRQHGNISPNVTAVEAL